MGNMLAFFPEYIKKYEVFKMRPRTGGGYGERYDKRAVDAYWSWHKPSKVGVEGDFRTANYQATFWVKSYAKGIKIVIDENKDYVEVDGKIFLVIDHRNYTEEGGFHRCLMQRLEGPTDQQVTNRRVDGAIAADY